MVLDSLQNYVNLVSGASKASRERASAVARGLLAQAGLEDAATDAQERISRLADDIVNASRANRELLENLIGSEVEKAAARLGFARTDQLDDLQAQIAELRHQLDDLTAPTTKPAKKAPAKAAPAKKTPAAPRSTAPRSAAPRAGDASVARTQTTKKAPAVKAAARKSPAEKAAARTSPAVAAAKRTSAAERAAKRTVAKPGPIDSAGEV